MATTRTPSTTQAHRGVQGSTAVRGAPGGQDEGRAADAAALAARVRGFVREHVIPVEERTGGALHGPGVEPGRDERVRRELQDAARAAGLFVPHLPPAWGGHGLDLRGQAVVLEAAGYSLLGPLALGVAAPDEGNGHLLARVGTPEQQERWLAPLARGDVRSAFAMTEPAPGAGSDPRALRTRAERVPGGWRLTGRKHLVSGARGAGVVLCMARTSGEPGDAEGATLFLLPGDAPGLRVVRDLPTVDAAFVGGHGEIALDGCFVPDEDVLGEVGGGFRAAQVRLAPARLTHCMRWLGLAGRAADLALAHVTAREAFGAPIADLGLAQQHLADTEIDLAASRALVAATAATLDAGSEDAGTASSVAKVFVSEAVGRVVDRSVQLAGGLGVCDDLLLARYWREVRPFRVYDGSSETHRWAVARRAARRYREGVRHDDR